MYNAFGQVGFIGQPFFLNFHFSGSKPTTYSWYKNGLRLHATPGRVSFDHTGVTFVKLMQHDAGEYRIKASNSAGRTTASVHLRGKSLTIYGIGTYTQTCFCS